jgi:oligoribonuclease NrnB/cAMP/cGMP phosphodiesterase (DHH superfamily)
MTPHAGIVFRRQAAKVRPMPSPRRVTVVSHGPNCLDGLTCAVVAARYFHGREYHPTFASNRQIDDVLRRFSPSHPESEELWITDISWRDEETTQHLNELVRRGLELHWVDHHKSALEARERGKLHANFTDFVLDMRYAASRLLYEELVARDEAEGRKNPDLLALHNLVQTADDNDRWILAIEGSRELALTVRAMEQSEAYKALLALNEKLEYGPELRRAFERVQRELTATFRLAENTMTVREVPTRGLRVISAECDGYSGEVADRWRDRWKQGVFALYDRRGGGISFRRTPDCKVDLSRLAASFGGGGHEAAAGCEMEVTGLHKAETLADRVADAIAKEADL